MFVYDFLRGVRYVRKNNSILVTPPLSVYKSTYLECTVSGKYDHSHSDSIPDHLCSWHLTSILLHMRRRFRLGLVDNMDRFLESMMKQIECYEAHCQKMYRAPCEDSDQPAFSCSLIRTLARCILDSQGYKVSACGL